jgi:TPR repeat protein
MSHLAHLLAEGRGGPADPAGAGEWYRKAAAMGDADGLGHVSATTAPAAR